MLDIILIIIAVVAGFFIIRLLVRKFPYLANINVNNLPEVKANRQKQLILQNRLYRLANEFWVKIKELVEPWQDQVNSRFKNYYQRLKVIEKDLQRRGQERLSSAISKSQTLDEMLTQARQQINDEDYQAAENLLIDVLSLDNHNVEAYKLLAEVYRARKEYEQARETLEYLLKLTHESDPAVYFSLADIAKQRGNLKQAEEDYLKSISLSDDNYLYFLSLAEVYLDLDQSEKALSTAQRALILSPNNPKILDFLINLSIIIQDQELAKQYLNKLREVNPENNKLIEFGEQIDALK
ncbi:MAG: tetratricopeptide repeat protein [Patescibacteria group bacterium]